MLQCGNVDTLDPCSICSDPRRDRSLICVIEDVGDLWALERAGAWRGLYHVLGGTLSALGGVRPEDLSIGRFSSALADGVVKEVVLATNATVEGQTTAHYITERLKEKVSPPRASPMACRWAANWTTSTKARSPRRCGPAAPLSVT